MTAIDDFFSHYYGRRPVNATFTGVHAFDHQLPDWSDDGLAETDSEMAALGAALSADFPVPPSATSFRNSPDLLDAELARGFLEVQRAENASLHGPRGNPSLWVGEAIFSIIALMIRDFAPVEDRVASAVERLEAIPSFLCADPAADGVRFASTGGAWAAKAVRECQGADILLSTGVDRWIGSMSDVPAQEQRNLKAAAERARASFHAFSASLQSRTDRPDTAAACGPDLFDVLLSRGHFCTRPRADLLADVRARFNDARARLETVARAVAGSVAEAQAKLAADHPSPNDYAGAFGQVWRACLAASERANAVSWPDWPIRYVPYPAWTADAAPYLYYLYYRSPAPLDPYTTYDYVIPALPTGSTAVQEHLRVWNNSTIKLNHVVHHGAIGHHVQNWHAYNQRRSRVGAVAAVDCATRIGMFCGGTMAEGWACYATDLMEELGFLTPLEEVSQQHTRVRMLARAIVDIELHQGSMSLSDAVAFYSQKVGMSADAARGEAVKNSMFPCTALMYWLGTQGIHDLRAEVKGREGPRFSLRRFHGELLGYGSVPVSLLARMITEGQSPLRG